MHSCLHHAANRLGTAAAIVALLAAGSAHADLYGFVDERGVTLFHTPSTTATTCSAGAQGRYGAGIELIVMTFPFPAQRTSVIRLIAGVRSWFPYGKVPASPRAAACRRHGGIGYNPNALSRKGPPA